MDLGESVFDLRTETLMRSKLQIITEDDNMKPIHPGRILKREMEARDLSANKLALALRVPSGRISLILSGKRGVSAETALRLSQYFGTSAHFWMNLQIRYDLAMVEKQMGAQIKSEVMQAA
jgi:addiction module HigA family antidote